MAADSSARFRSTVPLEVLAVLRRAARPILLTTAAAAVVSAVVALQLPNLYPATTTFYATNLETSDPDQLASGERKVVLLPQPEDLDRAVNIGRSQQIADYMIRRHRLAAHYNLDTATTPEAMQYVREKFNERLSLSVNDRDAVELTFIDTDRDLAARIANELVDRIDSASIQLTQPNRARVLGLFETRYRALSKAFDVTRDSLLANRRRYGINGMEQESRYLSRELVTKEAELTEKRARLAALRGAGQAPGALAAEVAGLEAAVAGLTRQGGGANSLTREGWLRGSSQVNRLQAELGGLQANLVGAKSAYETTRANLAARVSTLYVVQPAYPVARKVHPVRWLIVAASTVAALLLTSFAALLLEAWRRQLGHPAHDEPAADSAPAWAPPSTTRPEAR